MQSKYHLSCNLSINRIYIENHRLCSRIINKGWIGICYIHKETQKKRFVHTIVIIFIIITILSVQFYTDIYYLLAKNGCKDAGLCLFYNSLNPNMNFEIPIIILSIPSAFLLEQYHINHFNKFDYYIKERIGFKKYIYQSYVRNFINSFLLILSIYISMIFVIHFF